MEIKLKLAPVNPKMSKREEKYIGMKDYIPLICSEDEKDVILTFEDEEDLFFAEEIFDSLRILLARENEKISEGKVYIKINGLSGQPKDPKIRKEIEELFDKINAPNGAPSRNICPYCKSKNIELTIKFAYKELLINGAQVMFNSIDEQEYQEFLDSIKTILPNDIEGYCKDCKNKFNAIEYLEDGVWFVQKEFEQQ